MSIFKSHLKFSATLPYMFCFVSGNTSGNRLLTETAKLFAPGSIVTLLSRIVRRIKLYTRYGNLSSVLYTLCLYSFLRANMLCCFLSYSVVNCRQCKQWTGMFSYTAQHSFRLLDVPQWIELNELVSLYRGSLLLLLLLLVVSLWTGLTWACLWWEM